jgi:hypothetical protein
MIALWMAGKNLAAGYFCGHHCSLALGLALDAKVNKK